MALTELEVKKTKPTDKQQKLSDGGGLYLLIHPNGGKYWRMDYRFNGKQKTLSLGVYPDVSLDFDLDAGCWVIPEEQTGRKGKMGRRNPPAVPLSAQAVKILRDLYPVTGQGEYVFPNRNSAGRVISENTVLKIIETIGYKGRMTGHGFRSLARSILGEMGHRWEVLEAMLSHALVNQTAAAYVRTTYFEERRSIMQQWADYLDKVEAGAEVIPLRA